MINSKSGKKMLLVTLFISEEFFFTQDSDMCPFLKMIYVQCGVV